MIVDTFFLQKKVALVGPSRSIRGSHFQPLIDAHDLVVRMNHQWPFDQQWAQDLGSRTDILYHCCNADFSLMRLQASIKELSLVCYEEGVQTALLQMFCRRADVPSLDVTAIYRRLETLLGAPPSTGLVALTHLLEQPLAQLSLFGMTFFQEGYYEGYLGRGADSAYWGDASPPKYLWKHNTDAEFQYFLKTLYPNPKVTLDPHARAILRLD